MTSGPRARHRDLVHGGKMQGVLRAAGRAGNKSLPFACRPIGIWPTYLLGKSGFAVKRGQPRWNIIRSGDRKIIRS